MQSYQLIVGEGNVITLPSVPWVLSQQEQKRVNHVIGNLFTPINHMHCLKGAFTKDKKLSGLKTHDWHKFLQYILFVAINGCSIAEIHMIIYKMSDLVRWISQKDIQTSSLGENIVNATKAFCMLEK